jgi:DNA-binding PadR family transcriptional regulator
MEDRGWVVSCWEEARTLGPPRRVYRLTELGNEVLGQWAEDLKETRQMIDHILASYALHMKEGRVTTIEALLAGRKNHAPQWRALARVLWMAASANRTCLGPKEEARCE